MRKIIKAPPVLQEERGAVLVLVAIALFSLLAFSALAIDLGNLYVVQNELQNAADAGALAGAANLYNAQGTQVLADANNVATQTAILNKSGNDPVQVSSVERGHYSFTSGFTPNNSLDPVPLWNVTFSELDANTAFINAVRVTTFRPDAPSFFARILGYTQFALSAQAVAYVGFAGTLQPHDVDQPIAVCRQSIEVNGTYTCGVGRMINSGSNPGHETGGWTNFSQPCATASASSVRPLVCAEGNLNPISLGDGVGTTNGQVQSAFNDLYSCWKPNSSSWPTQPWKMTLLVIDCSGNSVSNCSEVVGAVELNIIWITQTDKNQMNEVPTTMGNWTCPSSCASAGGKNGPAQCCWNSFVSYFHLRDVFNGTPATYEDKSIYFLPDCTPHEPQGTTGGENFGILARLPVLVK